LEVTIAIGKQQLSWLRGANKFNLNRGKIVTNFSADVTLETGDRPKHNPPDRVEESESWQQRVDRECAALSGTNRASAIAWLEGATIDSYRVECQYRILRQHYLATSPKIAYKTLMERLGNIVIAEPKIRDWVRDHRTRTEEIIEAIETIVITLVETDSYCRHQIDRIRKFTIDRDFRNYLLLATVEEYCQHSIRQLVIQELWPTN
jgi:hypothetical protein